MMKLVQNWPKIDRNFKKYVKSVWESEKECVKVCLMHTLTDTQNEDVGPEWAKIAQ